MSIFLEMWGLTTEDVENKDCESIYIPRCWVHELISWKDVAQSMP